MMEVEVSKEEIEMISGGQGDEVIAKAELEIGIGFSAEGNKGKGSANLKVKLVLSPKS